MTRNNTIDIGKGIVISLMVIGHCYSKENIVLTTIYAFHMPFFFVVSGMLYAEKWKEHVSIRIWDLCRKLLIPYVVFELLFSLFLLVLQRSNDIAKDLLSCFIGTILPMIGTTVTWFLPCQLCVVILSSFIVKLTAANKKWLGLLLFFVPFILAITVATSNRYLVVLWRVLIGMGYFAIGYYGKEKISRSAKVWEVILCGILFAACANINGLVSLVKLDFSNPVLYVINSVLGTYVVYQLCLRDNKCSRILSFLGKNTAGILCMHMFAVEIIRILDYKVMNNMFCRLDLLEGIVLGGIVLVIMYITIPVYNWCVFHLFGIGKRGI